MKPMTASPRTLCACRECQGTSQGIRPAWWPDSIPFAVDLWPNSFSVPVHEVIVSPLLCSDTDRSRAVVTVMLELSFEGDSRQVGGTGWNHDEEIYQ